MIVRELITRLGFDVESSKFNQFDRKIGLLKSKLEGVDQNISRIADNMGRMGRKLSIALSLPLAIIGGASIIASAQIEQVALSFDVMFGSAEKGLKMMNDLFTFAKKTPFEIQKIGPTAKQLIAMGIESEKLIDTLTILGNAAAGTGVPLQRLAYNFGQVKSQTFATTRDLREFAMAGVPILATLSKLIFGTEKHVQQVRKMASQGKIAFALVEKAFENMSAEGGKYNNLMKRMADETLTGVWSNFLDGIFLARVEVGNMIVKTLDLKNVFKKLNIFLDKVVEHLKSMDESTRRFIVFSSLFTIALGPMLIVLGGAIKLLVVLHKTLIIVKVAMFAAAGGATTFNASMVLIPVLILLAVAAFALFVDDVIGWIRGRKSLTGKLLGPWEDFAVGFKSIWKGLSKFLDNIFESMFTGNFDKVIADLKHFKKTLQFLLKDLQPKNKFQGPLAGVVRDPFNPAESNPLDLLKQFTSSFKHLGDFVGGKFTRGGQSTPATTGGRPITINNDMKIFPSGSTPFESGTVAGSQFLEGFNRQIRHALSTETVVEK